MGTRTTGKWMIYGANGYTGRAMAEEVAARLAAARAAAGGKPVKAHRLDGLVLGGRSEAKLRELGGALGFSHRCFDLSNPKTAAGAVADMDVVVHCAGPFSATAAPMREACLTAHTHYLDITGEISVLAATHALDARAKLAGAVLMSGTGFDVVPSDCLALALKQALPSATRLSLAFASEGGVSQGTAKTMIEGLGEPGAARVGGAIVPVPVAWEDRDVPFPCGVRRAVTIPWGDVATAYFTTGIPDVKTFIAMPPRWIRLMRWTRPLAGILKWGWVRDRLRAWVERTVTGPTPAERLRLKSYLWGEAADDAGRTVSGTLVVPEGYRTTVLASLAIVARVLDEAIPPGAWTPAGALGADFILELPGTERKLGDAAGRGG